MRTLVLLGIAGAAACAPPHAPPPSGPGPLTSAVGVVVMAHGGSDDWNRAVDEAVAPLAAMVPTAVAYGMADPRSLQAALDSLRDRGVGRVAVVRMFLSGRSFLDQTKYLLGLSDDPPASFILMGPSAGDPGARAQLVHGMAIATHREGLMVSIQAGQILAERAGALSSRPSDESVLIVAHGMGGDGENEEVIRAMETVATIVARGRFARVEIATLREDWEEKRAVAEQYIRHFVSTEGLAGRRVIVLPFRLSGFGPYSDVLDGLEYREGPGLLPHAAVAEWVQDTADRVTCAAGWGPAIGPCH